MTKLIDILRNLLTAPKDAAEFELLAEQKIGEIEDTLNETASSLPLPLNDDGKVKRYDELTVQDVKNIIKKAKLENLTIKQIKVKYKEFHKQIMNLFNTDPYYTKSLKKFPTSNEMWIDLGIKPKRIQWYKYDTEFIKNYIQNHPELKNKKEKVINDLHYAKDIHLRGLYNYLNRNIEKMFPEINNDVDRWKQFGITSQGSSVTRTKEEYVSINNFKTAKEYLDYLRNVEKKQINTISELTKYDINLYKTIYRNVIQYMSGYINYFKWKKLGLISPIDWKNFKQEDFKQLIKNFNFKTGENYLTNLPEKVQEGILNSKHNLPGNTTREKYNNIGLIYTPLSERIVYEYKFIGIKDKNGIKNNYIYVGLTCNPAKRNRNHTFILEQFKEEEEFIKNKTEELKNKSIPKIKTSKSDKSSVNEFIADSINPKLNSNWQYNLNIIKNSPMEFVTEEGEFVSEEEAIKLEKKQINEYKNSQKWIVLNKLGGGGTGGKTPSNPNKKGNDQLEIALDALEQSQNK